MKVTQKSKWAACPTRLTAEQARQYERNGFLAFTDVLSAREAEDAKAALSGLVRHVAHHPAVRRDGAAWITPAGPLYVQFEPRFVPTAADNDELELKVRKLMGFVGADAHLKFLAHRQPRIRGVIESLLGVGAILFQDMALIKPPFIGSEKPWHQDTAYFRVAPLGAVAGVWIALDDATVANGCMHVIPGGHHQGPKLHFHGRDCEIAEGRLDLRRQVPLELPAGGAMFFHGLLPHQTPPNSSPDRRRALQFHYRAATSRELSRDEYDPVCGRIRIVREAKESRELLEPDRSPPCRLFQITHHPTARSSTIYMESPVWSPDGRFFLFQRFPRQDQNWGGVLTRHYFICDTRDNFSIRQITDEEKAIAPAMSPDGKWVYYFVDETTPGQGTLTLKRVGLDGLQRETIMVVDKPIAGKGTFPSHLYSLATIRSDGQAIAIAAFLGDGQQENAPWGVIVFDLAKAAARIIFTDPEMCNAHPQYSRSTAAPHRYDLLVQHNHGSRCDAQGNFTKLADNANLGCDIHVIRDDGTNFRDVPFGRSRSEIIHGHQEWRGVMDTVVGGVFQVDAAGKWISKPILEGRPAAGPAPHMGRNVPGAFVRDLTPRTPDIWYGHTAIDPTGTKIVSDWSTPMVQETENRVGPDQQKLFVGTIVDDRDPGCRMKYLLNPRSTWKSQIEHPHPCLSPDGRMIFFNSDWIGGVAQLWLVTDFSYE